MNEAYPLQNEPLPLALDGKPNYDCKGFTALKVKAFLAAGVTEGRMRALIVREGANLHEALQLDDVVLDNLSPWLNKPSDYDVVAHALVGAMAGRVS